MKTDDEFFIGWQGRLPRRTGRRLLGLAVALAAGSAAAVVGFAAWQRTIGAARWDYGVEREFAGVMLADPVPMLLVGRPEPESGAQAFLLVNVNKHGFDPREARAAAGQQVRLRASLLYRDHHAVLEVAPDSLAVVNPGAAPASLPAVADLGEHVLRGEIVDSKCYLGAMNPGVLKPHRACAILCLSGGVPPLLLVRHADGGATLYLLAGAQGQDVTSEVLDFVAEPVEVRGRVQRLGDQLLLRIQPGAVQRLP